MNGSARDEVRQLAAWGSIPPEPAWDDRATDLETFMRDAQRVDRPVTSEERVLLLGLLDRPDEDSLYGLLNVVVTLVESAPDTGWQLYLPTAGRPWFEYLRVRYINHLDRFRDGC